MEATEASELIVNTLKKTSEMTSVVVVRKVKEQT
jgi:hypothetical protein